MGGGARLRQEVDGAGSSTASLRLCTRMQSQVYTVRPGPGMNQALLHCCLNHDLTSLITTAGLQCQHLNAILSLALGHCQLWL